MAAISIFNDKVMDYTYALAVNQLATNKTVVVKSRAMGKTTANKVALEMKKKSTKHWSESRNKVATLPDGLRSEAQKLIDKKFPDLAEPEILFQGMDIGGYQTITANQAVAAGQTLTLNMLEGQFAQAQQAANQIGSW